MRPLAALSTGRRLRCRLRLPGQPQFEERQELVRRGEVKAYACPDVLYGRMKRRLFAARRAANAYDIQVVHALTVAQPRPASVRSNESRHSASANRGRTKLLVVISARPAASNDPRNVSSWAKASSTSSPVWGRAAALATSATT